MSSTSNRSSSADAEAMRAAPTTKASIAIAGRIHPRRQTMIAKLPLSIMLPATWRTSARYHVDRGKPISGLSYRDAGVDIGEGERLVELIQPLARSTRRPGVVND